VPRRHRPAGGGLCRAAAAAQAGFQPPPESAIPAGPFGRMVRLGEAIFRHTDTAAPQ